MPPLSATALETARREQLGRVAAAAGRAPSKHNSQPWRFLVAARTLDVWPDPARVLPETDPHRRELLLACGAAVQTALVLARSEGLDVRVDLLPQGTAGAAGRLTVLGSRDAEPHETALARAVVQRSTDRGPLDATLLAPSTPFLLQQAAAEHGAALRLVTADGERDALARLLLQADHRLAARRSVGEEVRAWSRPPGSDRRDGVASGATRGADASYSAAFVQRDFSLPGSVPLHARSGPDRPLLGVLTTDADGPAEWVAAGRALAQLLLELTLAGGAASFVDQAVEDPLSRPLLQDLLGSRAWPQLVLRLGVGGQVRGAVRRAPHDTVVQIADPRPPPAPR